jgi:threonine dehydratase
MLTLADIVRAQHRLAAYLQATAVESAPDLGAGVLLKLENTNHTHSFKIRGALNAVLALDDAARGRGVITASSGNHAQGVAYATQATQTRATILMPKHTPQKKVQGVRRYGGTAVLFGDNFDQTEAEALRRARDEGMTFVSPYNDRQVMAGAGTIGLEILQQVPDVGRVLVCVSGGGLISGIATAIKTLKPDVEVIGVGAESAPAMYNVFHGTDKPEQWDTLAEALSGGIEADSLTLPVVRRYVDDIVLVSEAQIAATMRWMLGVQGWLVEGGGSVSVAALLHAVVAPTPRPTVALVSGGNVDLSTLAQVIQQS